MADEHILPCLYMLWPADRVRPPTGSTVPAEYTLRTYMNCDEDRLRGLLEIDGERMSDSEWQSYRDKLLPAGLFVIVHDESDSLVATAGAVHNPNPGRYYFPYGGELGYLIADPAHRGKRLGQIVSASVVQRFLEAGYDCIRVCVKGWRLPAIKTYLRVGFVPFIYDEELLARWRMICEQIDWPYTPHDWPLRL